MELSNNIFNLEDFILSMCHAYNVKSLIELKEMYKQKYIDTVLYLTEKWGMDVNDINNIIQEKINSFSNKAHLTDCEGVNEHTIELGISHLFSYINIICDNDISVIIPGRITNFSSYPYSDFSQLVSSSLTNLLKIVYTLEVLNSLDIYLNLNNESVLYILDKPKHACSYPKYKYPWYVERLRNAKRCMSNKLHLIIEVKNSSIGEGTELVDMSHFVDDNGEIIIKVNTLYYLNDYSYVCFTRYNLNFNIYMSNASRYSEHEMKSVYYVNSYACAHDLNYLVRLYVDFQNQNYVKEHKKSKERVSLFNRSIIKNENKTNDSEDKIKVYNYKPVLFRDEKEDNQSKLPKIRNFYISTKKCPHHRREHIRHYQSKNIVVSETIIHKDRYKEGYSTAKKIKNK